MVLWSFPYVCKGKPYIWQKSEYRIAGNFGEVFNLAIWRIRYRLPNLRTRQLNLMHAHLLRITKFKLHQYRWRAISPSLMLAKVTSYTVYYTRFFDTTRCFLDSFFYLVCMWACLKKMYMSAQLESNLQHSCLQVTHVSQWSMTICNIKKGITIINNIHDEMMKILFADNRSQETYLASRRDEARLVGLAIYRGSKYGELINSGSCTCLVMSPAHSCWPILCICMAQSSSSYRLSRLKRVCPGVVRMLSSTSYTTFNCFLAGRGCLPWWFSTSEASILHARCSQVASTSTSRTK